MASQTKGVACSLFWSILTVSPVPQHPPELCFKARGFKKAKFLLRLMEEILQRRLWSKAAAAHFGTVQRGAKSLSLPFIKACPPKNKHGPHGIQEGKPGPVEDMIGRHDGLAARCFQPFRVQRNACTSLMSTCRCRLAASILSDVLRRHSNKRKGTVGMRHK